MILKHGGFLMKYAICIFPSKEIQDAANAYRKRYDPQFPYIAPHITLKYRFDMDDTLRDTIVEELRKIAQNTKPFTINITKVGTFAPVTNTVYLKVTSIPELVQLHEQMHSGKFPEESPYPFGPHVTIAQELTNDEYSDIYGSLQMKEVSFEDKIENFSLVKQAEDGTWEVYETFTFGKEG